MGQLMSTKNRTRRTTTRNIRPNQMIEQINIALEQKGVRNFSSGHWSSPSETNAGRDIHQLKVMKNEHPAFFPSEQDDIVIDLNYEGTRCNWAAVLPLFLTVTDCVLLHRLNSLNDYSYKINNYQGIILSYYYRAFTNAASIALNASQRHLMFYMQLQHQGNS